MDFNYGDFRALFTSDIGGEEEKEIIRLSGYQVNLSSIDVLKVAHHGSKYSSSSDFLKAVRPALAVIEVGKNSYGHPTAETLGRLKEVGAKVMRTDQDGDVVVETDGKGWRIRSTRK
jgi:competence protein ComEC